MKKVSIIILNWNGQKLLEQFLPSVVKYSATDNTEIIVADNCSTDNSINFISQNYPQVRVIPLPKNYGYAEGYNKAISEVEAQYLILLNSDVEVTSGWLEPLIKQLDNNDEIAALQPKILSYRNKEYFEYAGACGGFIDKYGYPFCRGRIFHVIEKDLNQYDSPTDIFWASGACLVIRKKDFEETGGFDSSFFAHMEEIDLCWRLNAQGKKIICEPQSTVYHLGAATLSTENPHKTFLNFRNNLLMLYKNLPEKDLKRTLRTRRFFDYIAAFQMILTGKIKNAKAIFAAYKETKSIIHNYAEIRKENIEKTKVEKVKTVYPKSILWFFYAKRQKTYNKVDF